MPGVVCGPASVGEVKSTQRSQGVSGGPQSDPSVLTLLQQPIFSRRVASASAAEILGLAKHETIDHLNLSAEVILVSCAGSLRLLP